MGEAPIRQGMAARAHDLSASADKQAGRRKQLIESRTWGLCN